MWNPSAEDEPRDQPCKEPVRCLMWISTMTRSNIFNPVRSVVCHFHTTDRPWKEALKIRAHLHVG